MISKIIFLLILFLSLSVFIADGSDIANRTTSKIPIEKPTSTKTMKPTNENSKKIKRNVGVKNEYLILVNKHHTIPANYIPNDLIEPNVPFSFQGKDPKRQMRQVAAHALEQLFKVANENKIELYAQSGYRSFERQKAIFAYNANKKGKSVANQTSAIPGQSEHQTGLAMDVTSKEVHFDLIEGFAQTKEGEWLTKEAPKYGFIIRFPKGKEQITGYQYEPWHLRYVGREIAEEITDKGITLEEYLGEQ